MKYLKSSINNFKKSCVALFPLYTCHGLASHYKRRYPCCGLACDAYNLLIADVSEEYTPIQNYDKFNQHTTYSIIFNYMFRLKGHHQVEHKNKDTYKHFMWK